MAGISVISTTVLVTVGGIDAVVAPVFVWVAFLLILVRWALELGLMSVVAPCCCSSLLLAMGKLPATWTGVESASSG